MKIFQILDLIRKTGPSQLLKIKKFHDSTLTYARNFMASYCICSLFNIGFFDILRNDRDVDLDSFVKIKNINKNILASVCDYLFTLQVLNKSGGRYSIGPKGKDLLKYSRGNFDFIYAYAPLFENLDSLLRNEKKYNIDVFRRDRFMAKATAEVSQFIPIPIVKDIIRRYDFKTILDLGCGSAEFLLQLCEESNLKGYGIDISEETIHLAEERINKRSQVKKVAVMVGDIFDLGKFKTIFKDVDAITCMFVMHEFLLKGNNATEALLKNIKENFPGRHLIVCELSKFSPSLLRKNPTSIAEHHLFHALSEQGLMTIQEWRSLFKRAGYKLVEEIRYDFSGQAYFVLV